MKRTAFETSTRPAAHRTIGFTLIEMMITLLVIAILAAIAVPIYQNQIRESRRTDARSALLELAAREERYYATNNAYTATAADLGYTGFGTANPVDSSGFYYIVAASAAPCATGTTCVDNTSTPALFYLTVEPVPGTDQANDSACTSFTVASTGAQTATGSGTDPSATCWGQ